MSVTLTRPAPATPGSRREQAALRRLTALMRAEAAELEPTSPLRARLDGDGEIVAWAEQALPEIAAILQDGTDDDNPWSPRRGPSPFDPADEAVLRRIAAHLRAEAEELESSPLGRRLQHWGVRLALASAHPHRPARVA